ncbi:hypothetical protein HaLaN_31541 [Haematococcus lacustris]|uniref:Uncharacterized protein n=1 Tax=Haematococcus lacustris TaxID=44745 RepID=A0A6A0AK02_HAELA|nr:hypothetical protein HaLaN_31541 [Haematococcus lacustris]
MAGSGWRLGTPTAGASGGHWSLWWLTASYIAVHHEAAYGLQPSSSTRVLTQLNPSAVSR